MTPSSFGLLALSFFPLLGGSSALEGLEKARRPQRIEAFWLGLGAAAQSAPVNGVVVLRPALERRVRIAGMQFAMGSTPSDMVRAMKMCEQEPHGVRCSDGAESAQWVRAEGYVHEVTVSDFEIDRTEVPVRRYDRCVLVGACAPAAYPSGDPRYDRPDFPVTHVRWEDAVAYCTWASGRLPTEAEWELAARGRTGHVFPWGDTYNPHLANHGTLSTEPTDARDGFEGLAPIGSFPDGATASGLLDMAGNAAEWVHDWYDRDEDGYGYGRGAVVNPRGPSFGPYGHVIRGGSYLKAAFWLRNGARTAWHYGVGRDIGFRCAYDVKDEAAKGPKPPAKE